MQQYPILSPSSGGCILVVLFANDENRKMYKTMVSDAYDDMSAEEARNNSVKYAEAMHFIRNDPDGPYFAHLIYKMESFEKCPICFALLDLPRPIDKNEKRSYFYQN